MKTTKPAFKENPTTIILELPNEEKSQNVSSNCPSKTKQTSFFPTHKHSNSESPINESFNDCSKETYINHADLKLSSKERVIEFLNKNNVSSNDLSTQSINHREATNYFLSLYFSKEQTGLNTLITQSKHQKAKAKCCLVALMAKSFKKHHLHNELQSEQHFIYFLLTTKHSQNDCTHKRIYYTIISEINKQQSEHKQYDCSPIHDYFLSQNEHSISIFACLQFLLIIFKYPSFSKEINYHLTQWIIFVFIKLSDNILLILNSQSVILHSNKMNSLNNTVNDLFLGMLYTFIGEVKTISNKSISLNKANITVILNQIENISKESISSFIWKVKLFRNLYYEVKDSTSFISDLSNE